ncbi:MerR family transcriptional regulator [Rugosibacter aromaticivorans]|uniref:MerR family transcriptional regulator n=1 Tax=Rugosibacter aromaticivorans TaxID=1565605 RepID=A0A0C5J6Q9_9PROT|nr:chaperone modulator CbpM [Rugosibacter aromaticivorans]AJP47600.1 MerR family transcriptional regulator [Rugosibacter aromaticivorans]
MSDQTMQPLLEGVILEELTQLTLADVCRACTTHAESIIELVDEGILTPLGDVPQRWVFTGLHLRRARVALRLQSDLGVNRAGAALAVQLLEEIDALRTRLRTMDVV